MRRHLPRAAIGLALLLGPAACRRAPPPQPAAVAHYRLETAWRSADGAWFYPRERLDGGFTGLATGMAGASGPGGLQADGLPFDPAYPAAAVQSVQLPVVLRVTDLSNGRAILVRADDRGPASPARVLGLDARAMALLGMPAGTPTPVRVEIDPVLSALAERDAAGGPRLEIAAAPVGAVRRVSLAPPGAPDAGAAAGPASGAAGPADADAVDPAGGGGGDPASARPDRLSQAVSVSPVSPVSLSVDLGRFTSASIAASIAARAGGEVAPDGAGRSASFAVRAGPFDTVAEADAALDRARRAGISGARITADGD